ncbi:D-ribitol-5-phosphate cytidylyltransferase [Scleropages formosus]|uniref:D-ribitol-5-phosphate cytidylyltransferase n=1 Tax=Scleropages formosus TaxID=113540 RepID=A0A8C9SCK6_SCLFO|nr:D-ribitol-5-phosphate cytidylyltransferase [Scleropages formosus]XP_029101912.1 D-ribitol-5-phosphate cytidylyltransferase [Scleropages formosus]
MESECGSVNGPTDPAGSLTGGAGSSEPFPGRRSVDFPVAAVLPAGGSGERTGLATPKQFCTFLNRPLISYTIQAFERVAWIENVVVVVAEENFDLMMDIIHQFSHKKVKVVLGGPTRHRSIFNGLRAFEEQPDGTALRKPKVVIIHDAVRPFVEEDFLLKITVAAKDQGASGAIRPLVSTVIAATSEGYLDHSLERAKYRASEMPQGFLYDIIYQAYQKCSETDFDFGTECLHLALYYCGTKAKLIEGPPTLWKVTYKQDLFAAESIIKDTLSHTVCVVAGDCAQSVQLAHGLRKTLGARSMQVDVISGPLGSRAVLVSGTWNFIRITMDTSSLGEIAKLVKIVQDSEHAILYPVVLILVHLNLLSRCCLTEQMRALGAIRSLAAEAKHSNILLYGILLNHDERVEQWDETMENVAQIAAALVKDRNPALMPAWRHQCGRCSSPIHRTPSLLPSVRATGRAVETALIERVVRPSLLANGSLQAPDGLDG